MNPHLENKFALVTASTGGIGLAIARSFAAEEARVIINGRLAARTLVVGSCKEFGRNR